MKRLDSWLVSLYLARQQFLESVLFLTGQADSIADQLMAVAERTVNVCAAQAFQRDFWPQGPRDWGRLDLHAKQVEVRRVAKVIAHAFNRRGRLGVDADALSALKAKLRDSTLKSAVLSSPAVGLKALLQLQTALEEKDGDWLEACRSTKDVLCDALAQAANRAKMEDAIVEMALFHAVGEEAKANTFISAHNRLFGLQGLLLGEAVKPLKGQVYREEPAAASGGVKPMERPTLAVGKVFQDHILERHTGFMAEVGAGTERLDFIASALSTVADQSSLGAIASRATRH